MQKNITENQSNYNIILSSITIITFFLDQNKTCCAVILVIFNKELNSYFSGTKKKNCAVILVIFNKESNTYFNRALLIYARLTIEYTCYRINMLYYTNESVNTNNDYKCTCVIRLWLGKFLE